MIKQRKYFIHYYIKLIKSFTKKKYKQSVYLEKKTRIKKIAVLYYIPKDSPRYTTWNDGFVDAIRLLKNNYFISMLNIADVNLTEDLLNSFDFLLVKSNWNWGPDKLLRTNFRNINVKKGLAIAGVAIPPSQKEMMYYDVLWYETSWYRRILLNHPNTIHAFGINKNALIPKKPNVQYDYITIGAFSPIKRMELVLNLEGKVLVIGEKVSSNSEKIIKLLKSKDNITIKPFVEYKDLPQYLSLAKTLYIPSTVFGGGERAILEARYCGLTIKIEKDNPKLKELIDCPIWDSFYYYLQLKKGIDSLSKL